MRLSIGLGITALALAVCAVFVTSTVRADAAGVVTPPVSPNGLPDPTQAAAQTVDTVVPKDAVPTVAPKTDPVASSSPVTQAPVNAPSDAVKAPTDPVAQAPVKAPSDPVAQAPVKAPSDPVAQAPVKAATDPVAQAPVKVATDAVAQAPVKAATDPVTQAPVQAPSDPVKTVTDAATPTSSTVLPNELVPQAPITTGAVAPVTGALVPRDAVARVTTAVPDVAGIVADPAAAVTTAIPQVAELPVVAATTASVAGQVLAASDLAPTLQPVLATTGLAPTVDSVLPTADPVLQTLLAVVGSSVGTAQQVLVPLAPVLSQPLDGALTGIVGPVLQTASGGLPNLPPPPGGGSSGSGWQGGTQGQSQWNHPPAGSHGVVTVSGGEAAAATQTTGGGLTGGLTGLASLALGRLQHFGSALADLFTRLLDLGGPAPLPGLPLPQRLPDIGAGSPGVSHGSSPTTGLATAALPEGWHPGGSSGRQTPGPVFWLPAYVVSRIERPG